MEDNERTFPLGADDEVVDLVMEHIRREDIHGGQKGMDRITRLFAILEAQGVLGAEVKAVVDGRVWEICREAYEYRRAANKTRDIPVIKIDDSEEVAGIVQRGDVGEMVGYLRSERYKKSEKGETAVVDVLVASDDFEVMLGALDAPYRVDGNGARIIARMRVLAGSDLDRNVKAFKLCPNDPHFLQTIYEQENEDVVIELIEEGFADSSSKREGMIGYVYERMEVHELVARFEDQELGSKVQQNLMMAMSVHDGSSDSSDNLLTEVLGKVDVDVEGFDVASVDDSLRIDYQALIIRKKLGGLVAEA